MYRAGCISFLLAALLSSCGEEKELTIQPEKLTINDKPVIDSVCSSSEMVTNYYQHFEDIINTLPSADKSLADVRKAFRFHITDSSLKEMKKGYMIYYLGKDHGLRLHSNTMPDHLDSVILFKIYHTNNVIKKEK